MPKIYVPASLPDKIHIQNDLDHDPTFGYDLPALQSIAPPDGVPSDFQDFWEDTYRQSREMETQLDPHFVAVKTSVAKLLVHEVSYRSWDGFRTGAWLVEPENDPPKGLMVVGHGYGGRETPEFGWTRRGYAALYVCARGFHLSARSGWPDQAAEHVIHHIDCRASYILRGCVAELWHAGALLIQRYPALAEKLVYCGGSFGGGLGALMLPWDKRFKRAHLGVPTFGHHPLRLDLQRGGSGLSVRNYWLEHPEVQEVLRYYDASTAATFIKIPVHTQAAMFDPGVCPPGQWSVANAIQTEGSEIDVIPCAHFEMPEGMLTREECIRLDKNIVEFLDPRHLD